MADDDLLKLIVYVPVSHADKVRKAMGDAGGGRIGNYTHCTFSWRGTGRFVPGEGSDPTIGKPGELVATEEEGISIAVERKDLSAVVKALREAHPYEEVAFDLHPLERFTE
jgi:hypothetical protein